MLQVLTLSVSCYRAAPQAAALELCKQFFIMYGREQGMVDPLRGLLAELVTITLASLRSAPSLSDNADLIDCFFAMLGQILKKQSGLFLCPNLDATLLLQVGLFLAPAPQGDQERLIFDCPSVHPVQKLSIFIILDQATFRFLSGFSIMSLSWLFLLAF